MSRGRRVAAATAAVVLIVVLAALVYILVTPAEKEPAPDFRAVDVYGTPFNLSDQKGKVVLLEFTAIDCTGCNLLFPKLRDIREKYGPDLVMVSVFTYPLEMEPAIREYRESHGANWTYIKDTQNLQAKYTAAPIPKTFVIDREGDIIYEGTGDLDASKLTGPIDEALRGSARSRVSIASDILSDLGIFGLAFMAGLVCFFSPCAFPMLPGYMTYYLRGKETSGSYSRAAAGGTIAALGIFTVYALVGLVAVALGGVILRYATYLQIIIGVILLAAGVLLLLPVTFVSGKLLEKVQGAQEGKGFYYGLFLYGVGYGAASQACTAPVFVGAVVNGFSSGSFLTGVAVLLIACFTALFLMIGITLLVAGSKKALLNRMKSSTEVIKKLSAAVMIIAGVYLLVEYWLAFG